MSGLLERGEGPTWVLVHGSASDASTWAGIVARTKDRRLLMYHRPGYGRDDRSHADLMHQVERLDEVMSQAGEAPLLIGVSFGAVVALEWARDTTALPRGLVLLEPPLPESPTAPPRPRHFFDQMEKLHASDPVAAGQFFLQQVLTEAAWQRMPELFRRRAAAPIDGIIGDCRMLLDHAPDFEGLRNLDLEVLLVGGERSLSTYARTLDTLEERLPRARRCLIPGAGHMAYSDAPDAFLAAVRGFEALLD